ncbi:neuroguidin-like isoform X2 [Melopsittacus undulatus]|uniref:neuroguidin-like isoform X2 n=1 Tax=Melopsittacus undulatus TaxID=13146 RepID=UPI00146AB1EF|nr:neuroguidin-like isoform X2 [Melopsittacus undulatus]
MCPYGVSLYPTGSPSPSRRVCPSPSWGLCSCCSTCRTWGCCGGSKFTGGPWGGAPALPRLLETRVVLEKMRPIEHRIKYQVEKLLRAAMTGAPGAEHPLAFHPEPSNMAQEPDPAPLKPPGLGGGRRYVPPHIIPVQYDSMGREQRAQEAARRRALSSSVLRELRDELSDAPQELWGSRGAGGERPSKGEVERTLLEESLLVRLSEPRGARRRRRLMTSSGGGALASITHFGASAALWEPTNQEPAPAKRRRKVTNGKRRRKGFRWRRGEPH